MAVKPRDGDRLEPLHRAHRTQSQLGGVALLARAGTVAQSARRVATVGARTEGDAAPGQHHHPGVEVLLQALEDLDDLAQRRSVEGVAPLRPVEPHGGDGTLALDGERLELHARAAGARSTISVISAGAKSRMGGPQKPVPRLT